MKSKNAIQTSLTPLFAAIIFVTAVWAQQSNGLRYRLVVLEPLGGPTSAPGGIIDGGAGGWFLGGLGSLSNLGSTLVAADTPVADPFNPGFNIFHAYRWQAGIVTHLDPLPTEPGSAGNNSYPNAVNNFGFAAGVSENGVVDPITGFQENRAVVWTPDGSVRNLGALGGFDSEATLINDRGEVAGWVENTTPDPFSFGDGAETQAFVWKNGSMIPLGTFADGTDSLPFALNESGLLVGCSTTSTSPAPTFNFAPFAPVLWRDGKISNLGSLGGFGGCAASINIRGQIVGYSNLAGDATQHGFLWDHGNLKDLGTTGGPDSGAFVINDSGDIIGFVDFAESGPMVHAALWRNGHPVDLKTLLGDSCSQALGMNSRSQVVGSSGSCDFDDGFAQHHATLWSGSALVDLNNAIPPNSGVVLVWAFQINDRGEISGFATLPNGDPRAFLLIPEDENGGQGDLSTSMTETKAVMPEMIGIRVPTQAGIRRTQASSARALRQQRQARLQRGLGFIRPPVN